MPRADSEVRVSYATLCHVTPGMNRAVPGQLQKLSHGLGLFLVPAIGSSSYGHKQNLLLPPDSSALYTSLATLPGYTHAGRGCMSSFPCFQKPHKIVLFLLIKSESLMQTLCEITQGRA